MLVKVLSDGEVRVDGLLFAIHADGGSLLVDSAASVVVYRQKADENVRHMKLKVLRFFIAVCCARI